MADLTSNGLPPRVKDITGKKFGKWTAIRFDRFVEYPTNHISHWIFRCDCGTEKSVACSSVVKGLSKTCGCSKRSFPRPMTQRENYVKHRRKRLEFAAKYRERNKDKIRSSAKQLRDYFRSKASERRCKVRASSKNTKLIAAWIRRVRRSKVRCYYCGEVITKDRLNIDHIIPVIQDGPHSIENLAASCAHCNKVKNRNSISTWEKPGQQMLGL